VVGLLVFTLDSVSIAFLPSSCFDANIDPMP